MTQKKLIPKSKEEIKEEAEDLVEEFKDIMGVNNDSSSIKQILNRTLKDLSKAPVPKQLAVGAGVGWLTGYVTMKVGKMAATALGGSLLLLQIAHHKGYINVNWNKLSSESTSLAEQVKDRLRLKSKSKYEKLADFASQNIYLAGGFTGGFFLGIASS